MDAQTILGRLRAGEDIATIRFVPETIWLRVANVAADANELDILTTVAEKVKSREGTGNEHFMVMGELAFLLYKNHLAEESRTVLHELITITDHSISQKQVTMQIIDSTVAALPSRSGQPPKRKSIIDEETNKRTKLPVEIPPSRDRNPPHTVGKAATISTAAPKRRGRPPKVQPTANGPKPAEPKVAKVTLQQPDLCHPQISRALKGDGSVVSIEPRASTWEVVVAKRGRGRPRKSAPASLPYSPWLPQASSTQTAGPSSRTRASAALSTTATDPSFRSQLPAPPPAIMNTDPQLTAPAPGPAQVLDPDVVRPEFSRCSTSYRSSRSAMSVTPEPSSSAFSDREYRPLDSGRMAPPRKVRMRRFLDADGNDRQEMVLDKKESDRERPQREQ
ncbi:hypothetical protein NliqN6_0202 [Naganishia liquefaciens]|uniref:Uncharacterized protein n=1 Tax=Naganishia liquefaciens TaxID=104408 RepID=A0A8H3YC14_9TREE|nr:hypothetical protein NliqN6_0202 [Naganishia liquefaciens]